MPLRNHTIGLNGAVHLCARGSADTRIYIYILYIYITCRGISTASNLIMDHNVHKVVISNLRNTNGWKSRVYISCLKLIILTCICTVGTTIGYRFGAMQSLR